MYSAITDSRGVCGDSARRCVCVCISLTWMYVCVVRWTVSIYSGLSGPALQTVALLWIFKEPIHY